MARNKAYDIVQFEAGMNDHADARDIEDNEVALLNNLLVTNKGVIQAGYANSALATGSYPVLTPTSSTGVDIVTKNLWSYKNDFNISLNESACLSLKVINCIAYNMFLVHGNGPRY